MSVRLTNGTDATLVDLTAVRLAGPDATYQIELPLASIARGDYLIAIAAARGEERTRALVPIRVLSF